MNWIIGLGGSLSYIFWGGGSNDGTMNEIMGLGSSLS